MMAEAPVSVTELLVAAGRGDAEAHEQLWRVIYDELRLVARSQMRNEAAGRTLQPTALVHEAYFRLFGNGDAEFANRKHFFAAAANVMRQIRIDDARKRGRLKRGGGQRPAALEESEIAFDQDPAEVLAVDEALRRLEREGPRKAEVVTMRYFAGMSREEVAEALGVSMSAVDKDWRFARTWLYRELKGE